MTPGIHPQIVSNKTINTDPHPLSKTERGGKTIANKTLQKLMLFIISKVQLKSCTL